MTKIHTSLWLGITASPGIHESGAGRGLFALGGRILQQRDRAPRSSAALLLRGFRGPAAEAAGAGGAWGGSRGRCSLAGGVSRTQLRATRTSACLRGRPAAFRAGAEAGDSARSHCCLM